jgi:hypothetical protein
MIDKPTAKANVMLALKLAIFCVLLFALTILIGLLVRHAGSDGHWI